MDKDLEKKLFRILGVGYTRSKSQIFLSLVSKDVERCSKTCVKRKLKNFDIWPDLHFFLWFLVKFHLFLRIEKIFQKLFQLCGWFLKMISLFYHVKYHFHIYIWVNPLKMLIWNNKSRFWPMFFKQIPLFRKI